MLFSAILLMIGASIDMARSKGLSAQERTSGKSLDSRQGSKALAPVASRPRRKLTIFLGAGASTVGDYRTFLTFPHMFWPTSSEPAILTATDKERALLSSIRRELARKKRPATLDHFLAVLSEYNRVLQNILADEQLRNRFTDSLLFLARIQELNQVVQRARGHICELTVSHYRRPPSTGYIVRSARLYKRLLDAFGHLEIFTTNYDLVPEFLFSSNPWCKDLLAAWGVADEQNVRAEAMGLLSALRQATFLNGFRDFSQAQQPCFGPWSREVYKSQDGESSRLIELLRLHGCVAWYYQEHEQGKSVCFDVRPLESIKDVLSRLCVMYPGKDQSLGTDPHAYSFERLYDSCLRASVLLFIGFAFRDTDVIALIFTALRNRPDRRVKVVIVDPYVDSEDLKARIQEEGKSLALPILTDFSLIDLIAIRSEFPPKDEFGIEVIVNALESN